MLTQGVWTPRQLPNPEYFEDKHPVLSLRPVAAVGKLQPHPMLVLASLLPCLLTHMHLLTYMLTYMHALECTSALCSPRLLLPEFHLAACMQLLTPSLF